MAKAKTSAKTKGDTLETAIEILETALLKEFPFHIFTKVAAGSLLQRPSIHTPRLPDFGTTADGGNTGCNANDDCGVVFKLAPSGVETVLYTFSGGADGGSPWAGVVQDSEGNLYGTTEIGGAYNYGTVFKLTPSGTETVMPFESFTVVMLNNSSYVKLRELLSDCTTCVKPGP